MICKTYSKTDKMSLYKNSNQNEIIKEVEKLEESNIRHINNVELMEKKNTKKPKNLAKTYINIFLETSSIHGMNHMVTNKRHSFEILLWLATVVLSVYGALYLSQTTWTRYQYSPTVVSLDRDMYAWNTTFPCVTICPSIKLNEKKLELYLNNSPEPNKELLKQFVTSLTNATYKNFKEIPDYEGIPAYNYMELILNVSSTFDPWMTIGIPGAGVTKVPTLTEMGLCYALNSNVAIYNSPTYREANRWDMIVTSNKSLETHPFDGEVFAQVVNLSTGYDVYIHGPQEFPDISTKFQHSERNFNLKLFVNAFTIYTAPDAAKLNIAQRRCRFPHENNLKHNAIYSYTMCRMECRIRLCLKYCNCVPHFYRTIGNEKVCDVKGLKCLSKYEDELYKLQNKDGNKIECDCLPLCDDVNYVLQLNLLQEWPLGTNMQWGIKTYPRMRYRRDIIFGFTDVLVAVGGMAGLFLGCSVLSFMEIVYFLTLRLICYARNPNA